jgi:hypothetical protein
MSSFGLSFYSCVSGLCSHLVGISVYFIEFSQDVSSPRALSSLAFFPFFNVWFYTCIELSTREVPGIWTVVNFLCSYLQLCRAELVASMCPCRCLSGYLPLTISIWSLSVKHSRHKFFNRASISRMPITRSKERNWKNESPLGGESFRMMCLFQG